MSSGKGEHIDSHDYERMNAMVLADEERQWLIAEQVNEYMTQSNHDEKMVWWMEKDAI